MTSLPAPSAADAESQATTIEEFISVAVHDLRNPIAVVRASAQMALRHWKRGDEAAALTRVESIITQTDRLSDLMEMFLDASRIEAGKLNPRLEAVSLDESLDGAANRVRQFAITSPVRPVELQIAGDRVGYWDKARIGRALKSLLENAYLYGNPDVPVLVEGQVTRNTLQLCFSGGGPGPLPEELPSLFKRFFRGHAAAEAGHPGSGLGLYTSRGIARAHGGNVVYAPALSPDSFELTIPLGHPA